MKEQMLDEIEARRFLLGQLSPEEQGRIEELAFVDPDTFTFLESAEDDLIDEFIQGDLSAAEEQQFKNYFLALPGRRSNLRISRLLQQHFDRAVAASPTEQFPFVAWFKRQSAGLRISMAAAAALALIILAVLILIRAWPPPPSPPIQAETPDRPVAIPTPELKVSPSLESTQTPAHVENKPKSVTPEKQKRSAAYAVLSPSVVPRTEGDGVQQLTLAPDSPTMTIELALITQRNFRSYEVALKNKTETVLRHWPNLKAERLTSGKALKIEVPASLLNPQESYVIVVSGVSAKDRAEAVASYPFEVKE
jgi:hypothetical protein